MMPALVKVNRNIVRLGPINHIFGLVLYKQNLRNIVPATRVTRVAINNMIFISTN